MLNEYVMGAWQARRQDFAARGGGLKPQVGHIFQYSIGCMQQP